jgi:hypothetical protein
MKALSIKQPYASPNSTVLKISRTWKTALEVEFLFMLQGKSTGNTAFFVKH